MYSSFTSYLLSNIFYLYLYIIIYIYYLSYKILYYIIYKYIFYYFQKSHGTFKVLRLHLDIHNSYIYIYIYIS